MWSFASCDLRLRERASGTLFHSLCSLTTLDYLALRFCVLLVPSLSHVSFLVQLWRDSLSFWQIMVLVALHTASIDLVDNASTFGWFAVCSTAKMKRLRSECCIEYFQFLIFMIDDL